MAKKTDPFVECLEPIRKAYNRGTAAQKRHLIQSVLTFVMTGRKG